MTSRLAAVGIFSVVVLALAPGCHRDGCVGGDDGACLPPSACAALAYRCDNLSGTLAKKQLLAEDLPERPESKARATAGDLLLENELVRVVLAAPSHPSELAPTGGSIIDLSPKAPGSGDQINAIYQAAGLLPRDAVHYDDHVEELGGSAEGFVAFVFRGHLEGDSRITVVTRYELRACEPGVRVRSDLYNGASDPNTLYLADGLLWGDNAAAPFVPGVGLGFRAPSLDLKDVSGAWREWPFVAARTQAPPDAAYAVVPCDRPQSAGFNDPTLSAAGVPLTTTLPGDGIHLERFIIAVPGPGLAPAVGKALDARAMIHGETAPVAVSGRVVAGGQPIDSQSGRAAALLFYEPAFGPDPDDPARRKPWSEAVPGADGRFTLALPADRSYRVQPYAFGMPSGPATSFAVARAEVDIGDVTLAAPAHLLATVVTAPGQPQAPGPAIYAELVLVPATPSPGTEPPSLYGLFAGCNPMLGPPHGASPACNRAVSPDGQFNLLIPAGHYYVFATRGPFATLDRAEFTVAPGHEVAVGLVVQSLPLLPAGVFSGDFHVHGAASYDSSIPDEDRVRSFLSSGVDLIVATDHDVVTSYEGVLDAMGAGDLIRVISGTEQTPSIPWFTVPGEDLPKTLGHFNFWPLAPDAAQPRNGAPWAELREPGQMMDDMDARFTGAGVRQLNHPLAESKLGRDQGFLRAIGYDPRTPIAPGASFAADVLLRTPGGAGGVHRNIDWDVEEVMTGASPANWLRYRALWFSLLSQGFLRTGTANSDTHSLSLEQVGYPRNLVFDDGASPPASIDVERFDDNVRRGHVIGTTGPVLDVSIKDGPDVVRRPGFTSFQVSDSASLSITVSFAPWIPVTEIRVIVNGVTTHIDVSADLPREIDHLGTQVLSTKTRLLGLSQFLPPSPYKGDAWLIVEAGIRLDDPVDVDGDGLPDLSDDDVIRLGAPALADYHAIAPGAWPVAFSNPFLIDLDGGGWRAPGLP